MSEILFIGPDQPVTVADLRDPDCVVGVMPDGSGRVLKDRYGHGAELSKEAVDWLRTHGHASPGDASRRSRLLADLAAEGSSRCCYAPGAMDPKAWPTATCDCKYVSPLHARGSRELTGCCEMRVAYNLLAET